MTAAIDELKALNADLVVDARGTSCPGPILAGDVSIPRTSRARRADDGDACTSEHRTAAVVPVAGGHQPSKTVGN